MVRPEDLAQRMAASPGDRTHRFGMFQRERSWVITLRDEHVMDAAVEGHATQPWVYALVCTAAHTGSDHTCVASQFPPATTPRLSYSWRRLPT